MESGDGGVGGMCGDIRPQGSRVDRWEEGRPGRGGSKGRAARARLRRTARAVVPGLVDSSTLFFQWMVVRVAVSDFDLVSGPGAPPVPGTFAYPGGASLAGTQCM